MSRIEKEPYSSLYCMYTHILYFPCQVAIKSLGGVREVKYESTQYKALSKHLDIFVLW